MAGPSPNSLSTYHYQVVQEKSTVATQVRALEIEDRVHLVAARRQHAHWHWPALVYSEPDFIGWRRPNLPHRVQKREVLAGRICSPSHGPSEPPQALSDPIYQPYEAESDQHARGTTE